MNAAKMKNLAKVLAPLLGGKACEITISGKRAYTKGERINIPAGDFTDPDFVTMANGYIDHELGHNAFTDFDVSQKAYDEDRVLNKLRNALEDVRMERLQGKAWPGAKINLDRLATLCVARGNFSPISEDDSPTKQVLFFCLYWGRFHINHQLAVGPLADHAESNLRERLGDVLVNAILTELALLESATSNQDCLDIARAILKLLKDEVSESDEDDDDLDDESDSTPDGEQSDDAGESESKGEGEQESEPSDADDESDEENGGDATDSDDESDEEQGGTNSEDESNGEPGDDSDGVKAFIQDILDAEDDDDVDDIHDIIAHELGELADEAEDEERVTDLHGFSSQLQEVLSASKALPVEEEDAKAAGKRAYKTMRRALIDSSMNQRLLARTGKRISKRRLAGVPAGSLSVFERRNVKPEPTAAVSILVDASGSMGGKDQQTVGSVAFALSYGLNTDSVKVQTTFYGIGEDNNDNLYRSKRYEDKQVDPGRFSVMSAGCTPTGEAMQAEILELINRQEDKKFLFVLTDGVPDDAKKVKDAIEVAKVCDIRVIPIGIRTGSMFGFEDTPFQSISDLSELDSVIADAISHGLLA